MSVESETSQAEDAVVGVLAKILYLEPEAIDRDQTFSDLGLDSILAVEFAAALQAGLGITEAVAAIDEQGTPSAFARYLAEKYPAIGEQSES